jgi:AraC-like DNA-binding protein
MNDVPITRAAHLIGFCEEFRKSGIPVDRYLEQCNLPVNLEECPDDYLNNVLATAFVGRTAEKEGIEDVGWLGARAFSESQLSAELVQALSPMPTVLSRLKRFFLLSKLEDSNLRLDLTVLGNRVWIVSDMDIPADTPGMDASNWLQVTVIINLIRSIVGPTWTPDAISFKATFELSDEAHAAFPNTRISVGAPQTAIQCPKDVLSRRALVRAAASGPAAIDLLDYDELYRLRALLRPYLRGMAPRLDEAAEIVGTTPRTLQRRLQALGTSYRALVETIRFDMAADMLADPDSRIVDVAVALGFEDQSNFGRFFRKFAGTSPGRYRKFHADQREGTGTVVGA